MSRSWNIRKPGEYKVVCKGCGVEFYTRDERRKFHDEACSYKFHHYESANAKVFELRRAVGFSRNPAKMFDFEADPDTLRPDDPHARVSGNLLGADDGTEDVRHMLARGPVWARHAGHEPPARWYKETLDALDLGIEKQRENEQEWAKARNWAKGAVKMTRPRLPDIQIIKVKDGYAESVTPPVCDFCSDIGPSWQYGCADFHIEEIPSAFGGRCWASTGEFLACPTCARLVDRGRLANLLVRAAYVLKADVAMLEQSALIMQGFFDHRDGTKEPFG